MKKFIVPAGTYFLGDPCYVLQNGDSERWSRALTRSNYFEKEYTEQGLSAIAFNTAYGDGEYKDNSGRNYGVDSGMIGLIPVELSLGAIINDMHVVVFTEPTECYEDDGVLIFGDIEIDTIA